MGYVFLHDLTQGKAKTDSQKIMTGRSREPRTQRALNRKNNGKINRALFLVLEALPHRFFDEVESKWDRQTRAQNFTCAHPDFLHYLCPLVNNIELINLIRIRRK